MDGAEEDELDESEGKQTQNKAQLRWAFGKKMREQKDESEFEAL